MKISTKMGDKGESGLLTGKRDRKSAGIFDVLGDLDELSAFLGLCKCGIGEGHADLVEMVEKIQNDLYLMMGLIGNEMILPEGSEIGVSDKDVIILEGYLEKYEKEMGDLGAFVKPGKNEISARFHVARTVCRRAERRLVELGEELEVPEGLMRYLNRLSDLLFVVAEVC